MGSLVVLQVFTLEVRKILAYRVDFWVQFVGGVAAQFVVAWFLWKAVFTFRGEDRIGEFTFSGIMLYYLLVPLVGRAIRGSEMGGISDEIYQGTLTRYLVYPVSFFIYKLTAHCAHTVVFAIQGLVAVLVFAIIFGEQSMYSVTAFDVVFALSAMALATLMNFALIATIELIAFWADNVWSLIVIVRFTVGLLGGGMLPLSLFPDDIRLLLEALPFSYLMSFPIRCLLGQVEPPEWGLGMVIMSGWTLLFTCLFMLVWNRGKYKYTGVGI